VKFTPAGLRYIARLHRMIAVIEHDYDRLYGAARMRVVRETLGAIAYGAGQGTRARARSKRNALNFSRTTRSRRTNCCGIDETWFQSRRSPGASSA